MKKAVNTGLPGGDWPFEWATVADGVLYTSQVAMKSDGTFETGDITAQAELTLANLRNAVEAAGGTMDDVTQVIVYLPDLQDYAAMNVVYRRHFSKPFPNRATFVANLAVPGLRIEVVAYAHVGRPKANRAPARRKPVATRRVPPPKAKAARPRPRPRRRR